MRVIERTEVQEAEEFGETRGRDSPRRIVLECGVCGGRLVFARMVSRSEGRRYSWLEGCLERLAGKEARHEYYARLEDSSNIGA